MIRRIGPTVGDVPEEIVLCPPSATITEMANRPLNASIIVLQRLTSLSIACQHLTGHVTPLLRTLSNLETLMLAANQFNHTIEEVANMSHMLDTLVLRGNGFTGDLPDRIALKGNMSSAVPDQRHTLVISDDAITGTLSNSVFNGTKSSSSGRLYMVEITRTSVSGTIPVSIFADSGYFYVLAFSGNLLSGTIPQIGWQLSALETLRLSNNKLSGTIPSSFYIDNNARNLRDWRLNGNNISGTVETIEFFTALQNIDFSHNALSGQLPNLTQEALFEIRMDHNSFSGTIPPMLLPNLATLHLCFNNLTGTLPDVPSLGLYVQALNFASNSLSGTIPSSYSTFPALTMLNLADNHLTGPVPDMEQNQVLTLLLLYDNDLCDPDGVKVSGSLVYCDIRGGTNCIKNSTDTYGLDVCKINGAGSGYNCSACLNTVYSFDASPCVLHSLGCACLGEPCANSSTCTTWNICVDNRCVRCGSRGDMCCDRLM